MRVSSDVSVNYLAGAGAGERDRARRFPKRADDVDRVETDLDRPNPIEADDTSSVRVVSRDGRSFGFGLTLCAPETQPARVLDAVRAAPEPAPIDPSFVTWHGAGDERRPVVTDVGLWCERAARTQSTFSTFGAPFAASRARGTS